MLLLEMAASWKLSIHRWRQKRPQAVRIFTPQPWRACGNYDLSQYTPAIILLTDGVSDGSIDAFQTAYEAFGADVPVFSIMFGSADPTQLEELAELTHARVFDGREDLIGAFRSVKGYN